MSNKINFLNSNTRIVIYYQTFVDLSPLINLIKTAEHPLVTEITLASIHFGYNTDKHKSPYIHLNNDVPNCDKFKNVFTQLKEIKDIESNIKINLLIGGAGTAFSDLFNNYNIFYDLLKSTVNKLEFIDGFNLDIEEYVTLDNIIMLVNNLKKDFPNKNIVFAPLAGSLSSDEPGMGGFSYKKLDNEIGDKISYYNVQCYGEYSKDLFDQIVSNDYNPEKIVMGMLSGQDLNSIINELENIIKSNPNFGGVAIWEYFNAPPSSPDHPYVWCEIMSNILYNKVFLE
jgi:hypothetical protein